MEDGRIQRGLGLEVHRNRRSPEGEDPVIVAIVYFVAALPLLDDPLALSGLLPHSAQKQGYVAVRCEPSFRPSILSSTA